MASTFVEQHGFLRVQGNRIVDKNGKPVQLRGMSLFWSQWIGKYYTADVVRWLRDDWKCTVVRAALAVEPDGYLKNPDVEKKKLFTVVEAAIKAGIYVIIDWHAHNAHLHTEQAVAFFGEVAKRYAKVPNVIYEPYNEPLQNAAWATQIKPYHEAVIAAIRRNDTRNLIVCGTRAWSQQVEEASLSPLAGSNIAYSLHFYAGTHKQWLRDNATRALKNGVALFITEFGTVNANGDGAVDRDETKKWWEFCDANGISWCNWSVADKNESSAALKPGTSPTGKWKDSELTPSGLFVRDELRRKNR
jgi:endoglucanase